MTAILVQFVFRLTFGMALAMAATPSSLVTSGFYRIHLWVLMGLNTFASLTLYSNRNESWTAFSVALGVTVASYLGAVIWLYERRFAGLCTLLLVATGGLAGCLLATDWSSSSLAWLLVAASSLRFVWAKHWTRI